MVSWIDGLKSYSGLLATSQHDYGPHFRLAIAMQAVLAVLGAAFLVMLFADGSYFSFVIAADQPWTLHWHRFPARATAFLFTAAPVWLANKLFHMQGIPLVRLYSFVFSLVILLQLIAVYKLAGKNHRNLLLFPLLGYVLGPALGYGFPSEMMLSPGFFWICLFLLIQDKSNLIYFYISETLLLFTHELSIILFSLIFVSYFYFINRKNIIHIIYIVSLTCVWAYLKLSGSSSGGDGNIIYVLDPRRVLNNPTLWLVILLMGAGYFSARIGSARVRIATFLSSAILIFCIFIYAGFNFSNGRYDSARTVAAFANLALGIVFLLGQMEKRRDASVLWRPVDRQRSERSSRFLAASSLIAVFLSSAIFLHQWNGIRDEVVESTNAGVGSGPLNMILFEDLPGSDKLRTALERWGPGTSWTWPYAGIMVAPDYRPAQIVLDRRSAFAFCERQRGVRLGDGTRIDPLILAQIARFACSQPPPERHKGLLGRMREALFG